MEAKIYFTIKLVCAVFIFRQLWIFIFNREMYGIWEKAYRLMRIVRINLWKYRKKRSEQKAREANKRQGEGKRPTHTTGIRHSRLLLLLKM